MALFCEERFVTKSLAPLVQGSSFIDGYKNIKINFQYILKV